MNNKLKVALLTIGAFLPLFSFSNSDGIFTQNCKNWYGPDDVPCYNIDYNGPFPVYTQIIVNGQIRATGPLLQTGIYTVADKLGGDSTVVVAKQDRVQFRFCQDANCTTNYITNQPGPITFHNSEYGYTEGYTCFPENSIINCKESR